MKNKLTTLLIICIHTIFSASCFANQFLPRVPDYEKYLETVEQYDYPKNTKKNNKEIVIIGAGPIGLMTALNTLKENSDIGVTLIEKRTTYSRNNVVLIGTFMPLLVSIVGEKAILKLKNDKIISSENGISLRDLEMLLSAHVEKIANKNPSILKVFYDSELEVEKVGGLKKFNVKSKSGQRIPLKPEIIIGTDGTNSIVAKESGINYETISKKPVYGFVMNLPPDSNFALKNESRKRVLFNFKTKTSNYFNGELSEQEFAAYRAIPESEPDSKKAYLLKVMSESLNPDTSTLHLESVHAEAFPVELRKASTNHAEINTVNGSVKTFLIGDSLFNTHFFTGSGLGNGASVVSEFSTYLKDSRAGKKALVNYDSKVNTTVSLGIASALERSSKTHHSEIEVKERIFNKEENEKINSIKNEIREKEKKILENASQKIMKNPLFKLASAFSSTTEERIKSLSDRLFYLESVKDEDLLKPNAKEIALKKIQESATKEISKFDELINLFKSEKLNIASNMTDVNIALYLKRNRSLKTPELLWKRLNLNEAYKDLYPSDSQFWDSEEPLNSIYEKLKVRQKILDANKNEKTLSPPFSKLSDMISVIGHFFTDKRRPKLRASTETGEDPVYNPIHASNSTDKNQPPENKKDNTPERKVPLSGPASIISGGL